MFLVGPSKLTHNISFTHHIAEETASLVAVCPVAARVVLEGISDVIADLNIAGLLHVPTLLTR